MSSNLVDCNKSRKLVTKGQIAQSLGILCASTGAKDGCGLTEDCKLCVFTLRAQRREQLS